MESSFFLVAANVWAVGGILASLNKPGVGVVMSLFGVFLAVLGVITAYKEKGGAK